MLRSKLTIPHWFSHSKDNAWAGGLSAFEHEALLCCTWGKPGADVVRMDANDQEHLQTKMEVRTLISGCRPAPSLITPAALVLPLEPPGPLWAAEISLQADLEQELDL